MTLNEVQAKLEHYCAYQERSHCEVRGKLLSYFVYGDDLEEVISHLIQENFLNEERFAFAYTSGKFRIKKWGKRKIHQGLKRKQISDYLSNKALKDINEEDYIDTLVSLLSKKRKLLSGSNQYIIRQKLFQFVYNKGYESELISKHISSFIDGI